MRHSAQEPATAPSSSVQWSNSNWFGFPQITRRGSRRNHSQTFLDQKLNLPPCYQVRCNKWILKWVEFVTSGCVFQRWLRASCTMLKSIITYAKLLLACTWYGDKVRNGFRLPALSCTTENNEVIVSGPQSSLRETANSNNQSIILNPRGRLIYRLGSWGCSRRWNANPYLQAREWEPGWVIMGNWKQALRTISSCERRHSGISLYLSPTGVIFCYTDEIPIVNLLGAAQTEWLAQK